MGRGWEVGAVHSCGLGFSPVNPNGSSSWEEAGLGGEDCGECLEWQSGDREGGGPAHSRAGDAQLDRLALLLGGPVWGEAWQKRAFFFRLLPQASLSGLPAGSSLTSLGAQFQSLHMGIGCCAQISAAERGAF